MSETSAAARPKSVAFVTLGCKINQYETEAIREQVLELGYAEVPAAEPADVYIVNTCSVTAMAGAKSRKAVLRAARTSPDARIVVVGCSSPAERERLQSIPQVALLAGNEEKCVVASFLDGGWRPGDPIPDREADLLSLSISRYRDRTRATIKVQDGCSNFCSFCIIPQLRGTSRSRHPDAVVEEVRRLAEAGYLEIVLSGVHLQDYGVDLDRSIDLVALLDRVSRVEGIARIRLSSIGCLAFTPELLEVLERPVFCRHWHIPIQAGTDEILTLMRRGYGVEDFQRTVHELRRRFDDPAITTDIIVGHPGETEEHFDASLALYRDLAFSQIHAFPFSFREGTLSSKLWRRGAVAPFEIRRRARALSELDGELRDAFRSRRVGREEEVLVEGESRDEPGWLEGLTERYVRARFPSPSPEALRRFPGTLQRVLVERTGGDGVEAVWAELPREAIR